MMLMVLKVCQLCVSTSFREPLACTAPTSVLSLKLILEFHEGMSRVKNNISNLSIRRKYIIFLVPIRRGVCNLVTEKGPGYN